MKVVLCDDDTTLLSVMRTSVLGDHDIVAETGLALEAVEMAERFDADLMILDLSLGSGSGKAALDQIRERDVPCEVIVFTAFAGERDVLLAAGAAAVIEKPNFNELEQAVQGIAARDSRTRTASDDGAPRRDRRRLGDGRPPLPPVLTTSPSGIEPRRLFDDALASSSAGDTLMVVALDDIEELIRSWGDLVATDHRLAVARAVRTQLRSDDRLSVDEDANLVVLVVGGDPGTASRIFTRVDDAWRDADGAGTIRAGYAIRGSDESADVCLARATGALSVARANRAERLVGG